MPRPYETWLPVRGSDACSVAAAGCRRNGCDLIGARVSANGSASRSDCARSVAPVEVQGVARRCLVKLVRASPAWPPRQNGTPTASTAFHEISGVITRISDFQGSIASAVEQ
nr:hypothetical protein GCM10020063_041230 [Dactylosporangium thailandense]